MKKNTMYHLFNGKLFTVMAIFMLIIAKNTVIDHTMDTSLLLPSEAFVPGVEYITENGETITESSQVTKMFIFSTQRGYAR